MATIDDNFRKIPPQNLEAESSVLGGILLENDAINVVLESLRAEDFYRESHRKIFRAMIELSGLDPARDIDVEIVGRRPGEKIHEELFNAYERPRPTSAEKILLAEREPLAVQEVESMFAEIGLLVLEGDAAGLAAKVAELSAASLDHSADENGADKARAATGIHPSVENPGASVPLVHSRDS